MGVVSLLATVRAPVGILLDLYKCQGAMMPTCSKGSCTMLLPRCMQSTLMQGACEVHWAT